MIRRCFLALVLVVCLMPTQGADKYTDEKRPYEFGFNIEGEQHRKEKKDENGIIMGEFGFITADGVYHVTVYATDENGNFKILSMKNIRVKPYPTAGERQGHSLALPSSPPAQPPVQKLNLPASVQARQPAPATPPPQKPIAIEPPGKSCSHCSIPTTRAPPPAIQQNPNYNTPAQNYPQNSGNNNPQTPPQGNLQYNQQAGVGGPQYNQQAGVGPPQYNQQAGVGGPQYNQQAGVGGPQYNQQAGIGGPQYNQQAGVGGPQYNQGLNAPSGSANFGGQQGGVQGGAQGSFGSAPSDPQAPVQRNPKVFEPAPQQQFGPSPAQPDLNSRFGSPNQPSKPMLISAQMQIVDKNTDIYSRKPGEKEGLPNGINKNDMTLLLYTFNYTVGFHGHHEEGYTNGAKKGYYYVTGRNGVRTRVDYEADENGFRPKITQEVLDLISDDVPKPETEKDEKYGLKGYEFKWIYYPENSGRR